MCEVCEKSFEVTMMKIIIEAREIKKDMDNEEFQKYLKTPEFTQYASKRIPEIVAEMPIFTVYENENGELKRKGVI